MDRIERSCRASSRIFVTVLGGVAEVESSTVPEGIEVEILDLDELKEDRTVAKRWSPTARAYAKRAGWL
jgi:hypothetical protein